MASPPPVSLELEGTNTSPPPVTSKRFTFPAKVPSSNSYPLGTTSSTLIWKSSKATLTALFAGVTLVKKGCPDEEDCEISSDVIFVLNPPKASIVKRPSFTVTEVLPEVNRPSSPCGPTGAYLSIIFTPSTLMLCSGEVPACPSTVGSPTLTITSYVPLGTAISHMASVLTPLFPPTSLYCMWIRVFLRISIPPTPLFLALVETSNGVCPSVVNQPYVKPLVRKPYPKPESTS